MYKLLLLEDELVIGENLQLILQREGYEVDWFSTGDEAVEAAKNKQYDLMILDVMLKQTAGNHSNVTNGLEVARIVNHYRKTPYVILTSRREPFDIMQGLDMGAEDYISKPYDLTELLARIRRICKRFSEPDQNTSSNILVCNDISLDIAEHKVYVDEELVHLAPQLYELLRYFMIHKNELLSKEQLYQEVWGYGPNHGTETNTLEVNIKRLRQAIGSEYITTVRGKGYILEESA